MPISRPDRFSWATDPGANVSGSIPVEIETNGYPSGVVAEPDSLNEGLQRTGRWTVALAHLIHDTGSGGTADLSVSTPLLQIRESGSGSEGSAGTVALSVFVDTGASTVRLSGAGSNAIEVLGEAAVTVQGGGDGSIPVDTVWNDGLWVVKYQDGGSNDVLRWTQAVGLRCVDGWAANPDGYRLPFRDGSLPSVGYRLTDSASGWGWSDPNPGGTLVIYYGDLVPPTGHRGTVIYLTGASTGSNYTIDRDISHLLPVHPDGGATGGVQYLVEEISGYLTASTGEVSIDLVAVDDAAGTENPLCSLPSTGTYSSSSRSSLLQDTPTILGSPATPPYDASSAALHLRATIKTDGAGDALIRIDHLLLTLIPLSGDC